MDVHPTKNVSIGINPYQYPKMPCQFQSVPPRLRHVEKILKGRRGVWTLRPSPDEGITSCFGRKIWLWLGKNVQMLRKGQSGWYLRLAKRFPSVGGPILRCVPGPTSPPCRNIQVHRLEAIGRHRFVRGWSIHTGNLGPNQPSSKAAIPLLRNGISYQHTGTIVFVGIFPPKSDFDSMPSSLINCCHCFVGLPITDHQVSPN